MIRRAILSFENVIVAIVLTCLLSTYGTPQSSDDYSKRSITELIDSLSQIDSQAPGIDSAALYGGFIADGTPGSFEGGLLGVAPPKVPPQMRELVRRGPIALPELIKHLTDRRPTKIEVGNADSGPGRDFFMSTYFSDEYDPRTLHRRTKKDPLPMERFFSGRYTVKVGDVCYVLIGQIVNRRLLAVRYQPTLSLIVNSPIEAPVLVEKVRNDWGSADAEMVKASLLEDIHANHSRFVDEGGNTFQFVNPALQRLKLFFPETYNTLTGKDLQRREEFEELQAKHAKTLPQ
jgi:hypothetical protein